MSTVTKPIMLDETGQEIAAALGQQNAILAAIASNGGGLSVSCWADVQRVVRMGLADKLFHIGDRLVCERATSVKVGIGASTGITAASIADEKGLVEKLGSSLSGTFVLSYDGNGWRNQIGESVTLSNWGISVSGVPAKDDEIVITVTASTLAWDVIGIDCDTPVDSQFTHSLTLQLHDCITTAAFDGAEYMFAAKRELPPGTYYFKTNHCANGNLTTQDVPNGYQFTTAQTIPVGGGIRHGELGHYRSDQDYSVARALEGKFTSYDAQGNVLQSDIATTQGAQGVYLGTLTARDASYAESTEYGDVNFTERQAYGSNDWGSSAIRQWLNSEQGAGAWWHSQHAFDRAPSKAGAAGFLYGLDSDFIAAVGAVQKRTAKNASDGGGEVESEERFFLLSPAEVFCSDGDAYPYYSNYSDSASASTGSDSNRIKYCWSMGYIWWLRSPELKLANSAHNINGTGGLGSNIASNEYGVAPACCIV